MTIPLILLAIPSIFLGMFLGLPLGDSRIHHWVEPVFEHGQAILYGEGHGEEAYALFGIDGALILASVTIAVVGIVIAWRLFGVEPRRASTANPSRSRSRRSPRARRSCTARRSTSGGSMSSTTCCSSSSAARSRTPCGGSTARSWTARSTRSDERRIKTGRGLRLVQTGRVQNYALGIAVGLIVMAGSYLLLVQR